MKAKVPKCYSLGIQSSSGKPFDPNLILHTQYIPFIHNKPIKFLGYTIQIPMDNVSAKSQIYSKLLSLMQKIDKVPVTSKQKLLLYRAGVCPRLAWDLTVSTISLTWVSRVLEAEATRFLKQWAGLARSGNPSPLYLPKAKGGLGLPSMALLFKKQQVSRSCQLLTSRDPVVRYAATKTTIAEEAKQRVVLKPMVMARDILATDPGLGSKGLRRAVKRMIEEEDSEERFTSITSQKQRGEALRMAEENATLMWASAVASLPSYLLKFALNACQDTLPHNSNLAVWQGHPSECKLCGRRQTLLHVLNNCSVALGLRRYNMRHDDVLKVIFNFLQTYLPPNHSIVADLGQTPYTFPPHIASRPDIVIWNDQDRTVVLLELTVCFETNFVKAYERKTIRYLELEEVIPFRVLTVQGRSQDFRDGGAKTAVLMRA